MRRRVFGQIGRPKALADVRGVLTSLFAGNAFAHIESHRPSRIRNFADVQLASAKALLDPTVSSRHDALPYALTLTMGAAAISRNAIAPGQLAPGGG